MIRRAWMTLGCLLLAGLRIVAQEAPATSHVRAESREIEAIIRQASDGSSTFRALVDRLQSSDVIVYVRMKLFPSGTLDGRIGLLSASSPTRFLVIELACPRAAAATGSILAHELYHAIEIASVPWVTNADTLEQYYNRIGVREGAPGRLTFETAAARRVGQQVRRELAAASTVTLPF